MLVEGEPTDFEPVTEPARFPLLKRAAIAVAVLLVLAVAAAFVGPAALPASAVRGLVADAIADATGQPVRIDGEVSLTLLPTISAEASGVVVGDPASPLLTVRRAEIDLGTLALVAGRMEVYRLNLEEPVVDLVAALSADADRDETDEWGWFRGLLVDGFSVHGGRLRYPAPLGGDPVTVTGIDLEGGTHGEQALRVAGTLRANEADGRVDILLMQPSAFVGGNAVPLTVRFETGGNSLRFEGTLAKRQGYASKGRLTAAFADPARLAAWFGNAPVVLAGRRFELETGIETAGGRIELSNLEVALGEFRLQGEVAVGGEPQDRQVSGSLRTATLHLDPLLATAFGDHSTGLVAAIPLLFPTGGGEIEIAWREIRAAGVTGGAGRLAVGRGADGRLRAIVTDLDLAGGQARVALTIGQSEGMTALETEVRLIGVEMRRLLGGENGAPLVGRANLEIDLLTVGAGRDELAAALTGSGAITVRNGQLLDPVLLQALMPEGDRAGLPFQHLTGSFEIAGGILTSKDMLLKAAMVSVVAEGSLDLARKAMTFRLNALRPDGDAERDLQPLILEGDLASWRVRPRG